MIGGWGVQCRREWRVGGPREEGGGSNVDMRRGWGVQCRREWGESMRGGWGVQHGCERRVGGSSVDVSGG